MWKNLPMMYYVMLSKRLLNNPQNNTIMKKTLTITFDTGSGDISSEWDEGLTPEEVKNMCEYTWCKAVNKIETSDASDTNLNRNNGKVWFHGIDTDTKAKVWYPVHISGELTEHQFKIGDHIDFLIGDEWQRDYATIHGFHRNSNLPIAETNRPGHDGCKWSYTFDLSKIRLTR